MIGSAASPRRAAARRQGLGAAALALTLTGALACASPSPTPRNPLEPLPVAVVPVPTPVDFAAGDVAALALLGRGTASALAALEAAEAVRADAGGAPSGLGALARDAANAALDPRQRRSATRALLSRRDVPDSLRARLEQELDDDPLRLADERLGDARWRRFGRRVNTLVEPVGRSLSNAAMLPFRVVPALVGLAVAEHNAPELSGPERQALDHWKGFLERHPDSPDAAELLSRVEAAQRRWYRTQRDTSLRRARRAWRAGDAPRTIALSERALRYAPEDAEATRLLARAEARAAKERAERDRALEAAAIAREEPLAGRDLALALLAREGAVGSQAAALAAAAPDGELADEAAFARALAAAEDGDESGAWKALAKLGARDDRHSNMARHARALARDASQNPERAWRLARRAERSDRARWLFFGPLANGARERNLPRPVEWLVEIPTLAPMLMGLPNRLLRLPFAKVSRRSPGVFARRYLARFPSGEHASEVRRWLIDFEKGRGNPHGALRLAEEEPGFDPRRLARLREDSAAQLLAHATRERRLDRRVALLRRVAGEFPHTAAAREAGAMMREAVATASAQHIRVTRGYLLENPEIAGAGGLALRPELLDDDPDNGELHRDGVVLLGGRDLELAFLAPSGRADDPPELYRERISAERLARTVALLDGVSQRNALLDSDQPFAPDADRDLFFERARFGLGESGPRVTARSTFVYEGMRERYGLVRGRESILPVDLVLQGSLSDFGLGAFPRIRMPRETPDAFLYR